LLNGDSQRSARFGTQRSDLRLWRNLSANRNEQISNDFDSLNQPRRRSDQALMSVGGRLIFRSDDFPERNRFSRFCEEVMPHLAAAAARPRGKGRFKIAVDIQQADDTQIGAVETTPLDLVRTPAHVRDRDDAISLILCRSGNLRAVAGRDGQDLRAGDGVALDRAVASIVQASAESRFWIVTVPRTRLAGLLPDIGSLAGTKLVRGHPAVRLLFGYLDAVYALDFSDEAHAAQVFANHLVDLIVLALGARGDARERVAGVRAARRATILREIDANLDDPRLNAAVIAHRLGISPRYVHQLFREIGQTFSAYVLDQRLERVAQQLREPRGAQQKIADIAFAAGFIDLSHFNRSFRRRFGETPTAIRAHGTLRHKE
jgi:AraC-like DNA-binding protein